MIPYHQMTLADVFTETQEIFETDKPDGTARVFEKAYIPLRSGLKLTDPDYTVNENGIPCCPRDPSLPMKPEGNTSHLRCGLKAFKFVCPKMKWEIGADGKSHRVCHCENPCTDSACGRMVYLYPEKDLRRCPGVVRGTEEWESTYKIRTDYSGPFGAICPDFESHHSGE